LLKLQQVLTETNRRYPMSKITRVIAVITSLGSLFAVAFSAFGQQSKKAKTVKSNKAGVTSSAKPSSSDSESSRSGTAPLIVLDGKSSRPSRLTANSTPKVVNSTPTKANAANQTLSLGLSPSEISSGVTAEKDISPPVPLNTTGSANTT